MAIVGFFVGASISTFLLSRLLLWLMRSWKGGRNRLFTAHFFSLVIASLLAGMGMADGGAFAGVRALGLYLVPQSIWLLFDLFRERAKNTLVEEEESVADEKTGQSETPETDAENEEASDEEASAVMLVKFKCEAAEMYIDGMSSEDEEERNYETKRFKNLLSQATQAALEIDDEFYQGAAIHQIVKLCVKANDLATAHKLLYKVEDRFLREEILNSCPRLLPSMNVETAHN